jgi:hypothetical protein
VSSNLNARSRVVFQGSESNFQKSPHRIPNRSLKHDKKGSRKDKTVSPKQLPIALGDFAASKLVELQERSSSNMNLTRELRFSHFQI